MNDRLGANKDGMDDDTSGSELDAGAGGKWEFARKFSAKFASDIGEENAFNPDWSDVMASPATDNDGRLLPFVSAGGAYWEDDEKPYVVWPSGQYGGEVRDAISDVENEDTARMLDDLQAARARALELAMWYDAMAAREIRDGSSVSYSIYCEAARRIRQAMGGE